MWEFIARELQCVDYVYEGGVVSLLFDASGVVERMRERARREALPVEQRFAGDRSELRLAYPEELVLSVDVVAPSRMRVDALFLALRHLSNLYLLANLACPGSFGAHELTVRRQGDSVYQPHVRFPGLLFEDALIFAQRTGWPDLSPFDPGVLWRWLRALGLGLQEATSQAALSALFSALHAAEAPFATPTAMLWSAQALESLFGARRGSIAAMLVSRGNAFLKVPGKKFKGFKQSMRDFYTARSEFVHGKGVITNPVYMEAGWADQVGDEYMRVSDHVAFAVGIIIACARKFASCGISGLEFSENIVTVPLVLSGSPKE